MAGGAQRHESPVPPLSLWRLRVDHSVTLTDQGRGVQRGKSPFAGSVRVSLTNSFYFSSYEKT